MSSGLIRKKVIKEEPYGNSGAIKVIYDNGGFGIRAGSSGGDYNPERSAISNKRSKLADLVESLNPQNQQDVHSIAQKAAFSGYKEPPTNQDIDLLSHYVNRAQKDLATDDPVLFKELGEVIGGLDDPDQVESVYQQWAKEVSENN